jgi:hypothetical protein
MNTPDLTSFGTISLGGLIKLLERRDPEQSVQFDFCGFIPTTVASYRGYYEHLALSYEQHRYDLEPGSDTVAALLKTLRAANGATYEGWKGGLYEMGLETPVWVAPSGECFGTSIVGLAECGYMVVLATGYVS